jgi:hypothetical protein
MKNKMKNFILVQIKDSNDNTITTFNGEPHHAKLLKDYITTIFTNNTGGQTIWIEIPAGESLGIIF